jgi:hypothetical protein
MLVIHGIYHWRPRRIAFRNDYCRACEARTVSALIRTTDVLHIFWIPLLPLGAWSRWYCTRCGGRPRQVARTRRGFKIAGAVFLAFGSMIAWVPMPVTGEDAIFVWLLRIGLPVALAFTIRSVLRHRPEPDFKQRLAAVLPYEGWNCPLCGGQLMSTPEKVCSACGAQHRPLASAA